MPKFSIIIPVYNVCDYVKRCLDSVFLQSYSDYEVIVVNDGSLDGSMDIVKNYDVKIINQKNMGLSAARNRGVKAATGDYLIFLDSDDYWEKDLLKEVNDAVFNNPDLVRFQIKEVFDDKEGINYNEKGFIGLTGESAFDRIVKYHFVENAWCYSIKREYWLKNSFQFAKGKIHEDFGIMPLVIMKASLVNSIGYVGYNYFQRSNSIMNNGDYEKTKRKVEDFYQHYLYLRDEINKTNLNKRVFMSFIANSLIIKITELNNPLYKQYKARLKRDGVFNDILDDTATRKLKKLVMKLSPKLFKKVGRR